MWGLALPWEGGQWGGGLQSEPHGQLRALSPPSFLSALCRQLSSTASARTGRATPRTTTLSTTAFQPTEVCPAGSAHRGLGHLDPAGADLVGCGASGPVCPALQ